MKPKILVIDDDETLTEVLELNLRAKGYQVMTANTGLDGIKLAYETHPDLIVLDVMMPEMDGYDTCKRLREMSDVPILFLTAKGLEQDLIKGFEVGGDDYVRKPFSLREVEARVQALLKRRVNRDKSDNHYDDGRLRIDLETQHVYRDGEMVHLTPTEFRLLRALVKNMGAVVTHEELLREAWGEGYTDATASLSLYIRYLREKIEDNPGDPNYILTKWGIGYWFADRRQQ
ncbi:MAG TPA: response regulator transcription factor [Chloroflexi bacterium]|nr:response regulator transcription factor [Chloroflexota bacterium]